MNKAGRAPNHPSSWFIDCAVGVGIITLLAQGRIRGSSGTTQPQLTPNSPLLRATNEKRKFQVARFVAGYRAGLSRSPSCVATTYVPTLKF